MAYLLLVAMLFFFWFKVYNTSKVVIPLQGLMLLQSYGSKILYFVAGAQRYSLLAGKAPSRLHRAFRPKTSKAYYVMFKVFVAFCILMGVSLRHL